MFPGHHGGPRRSHRGEYVPQAAEDDSLFPPFASLPQPRLPRSTRRVPQYLSSTDLVTHDFRRDLSLINARPGRVGRTNISVDDSRRFFRALYNRLGATLETVSPGVINDPYHPGKVYELPTTAEELIFLYNELYRYSTDPRAEGALTTVIPGAPDTYGFLHPPPPADASALDMEDNEFPTDNNAPGDHEDRQVYGPGLDDEDQMGFDEAIQFATEHEAELEYLNAQEISRLQDEMEDAQRRTEHEAELEYLSGLYDEQQYQDRQIEANYQKEFDALHMAAIHPEDIEAHRASIEAVEDDTVHPGDQQGFADITVTYTFASGGVYQETFSAIPMDHAAFVFLSVDDPFYAEGRVELAHQLLGTDREERYPKVDLDAQCGNFLSRQRALIGLKRAGAPLRTDNRGPPPFADDKQMWLHEDYMRIRRRKLAEYRLAGVPEDELFQRLYDDVVAGKVPMIRPDTITEDTTDRIQRNHEAWYFQVLLREEREAAAQRGSGFHPRLATTGFHEQRGYRDPHQRLSWADDGPYIDHPCITWASEDVERRATFEERIRDPWLRQNYLPNICWMSNIIELVNTCSCRFDLTYQKLWSIMGRPGLFDAAEASCGLNINDMKPVFDYYDRNVVIQDGTGHVVYQRTRSPQRRMNHVRPESWGFVMTNHHVYLMDLPENNANVRRIMFHHGLGAGALGTYDMVPNIQKHPYTVISPMLTAKDFRKPTEILHAETECQTLFLATSFADLENDNTETLENLMFSPQYKGLKALVVLVTGPLEEHVIIPLIKVHNLVPSVYLSRNKINTCLVKSLQDRGMILFKDISEANALVSSIDEHLDYCAVRHQFYTTLLKHSSTYNEVTAKILHNNVRGGLFGWYDVRAKQQWQQKDTEYVVSYDVNRLYPSTLMGDTLPMTSCFEYFRPVETLLQYFDLPDHYLLYVFFFDTPTLYCERSSGLCFKKNLVKFLARSHVRLVESEMDVPEASSTTGCTYVCVKAYLRTFLQTSTVQKGIQTVWNHQSLPRLLRKFALNTSIGKMGSSHITKSASASIFNDYTEANTYAEQYKANIRVLEDEIYLCQANEERVPKLQGGYLLHLWVLDHARMRMQELADQINRRGAQIIYVKCDELIIPEKDASLLQGLIPDVDEESLEAFGYLKTGIKDVALRDHASTKFSTVMIGGEYLYPKSGSWTELKEDIQHVASAVHTVRPIYIEDEWNVPVHDHARLLIEADVPGAGKSHAIMSQCDNVFVVCPTNALCVEFEQRYNCEAVTLHRFLRIGISTTALPVDQDAIDDEIAEEEAPVRRSKDYNLKDRVLLLDEIYMYPLDLLIRLRFKLSTCGARAIYATGDKHQLPPISDSLQRETERHLYRTAREEAVRKLFPKVLTLTECKRMNTPQDNYRMKFICANILQCEDPVSVVKQSFPVITREEAVIKLKTGNYMAVCYYNNTCKYLCKRAIGSKLKVGTRLVNRSRKQLKGAVLQVNYEYEVTGVFYPFVQLTNVQDNSESIKVHQEHIEEHMHWTNTRTSHSLQGTSVSKGIILFNLSSQHMTRNWIYVAMTRARNLSEVFIVEDNN